MSQLSFGNSFGFVGKDYALVASDCAVPRSIITMKSYDDKIQKVSSRTLFALTGDVGDRYVIIHFFNIFFLFLNAKSRKIA